MDELEKLCDHARDEMKKMCKHAESERDATSQKHSVELEKLIEMYVFAEDDED